jgi:histo-blood group ABO system transferase
MKKVNLLIIATNKYVQFLPKLIESVNKYFTTEHQVTINVFTNRITDCELLLSQLGGKIILYGIEHQAWPYTTLYRYHFFKAYQNELPSADYYFYIDADTIIKDKITGEEIFGDIVGTQHCGFVGKRGSYETRPESTSYVEPNEGERYYGGGFWGFHSTEFWKFVNKAVEMINTDGVKGIIPVWHDESVLNRYLINYEPDKVLTPSFHYPEGANNRKSWKENYPCKILLLDKNHNDIR